MKVLIVCATTEGQTRKIALKSGQTVDPESDREYTDWDALGALLNAWAGG